MYDKKRITKYYAVFLNIQAKGRGEMTGNPIYEHFPKLWYSQIKSRY